MGAQGASIIWGKFWGKEGIRLEEGSLSGGLSGIWDKGVRGVCDWGFEAGNMIERI